MNSIQKWTQFENKLNSSLLQAHKVHMTIKDPFSRKIKLKPHKAFKPKVVTLDVSLLP